VTLAEALSPARVVAGEEKVLTFGNEVLFPNYDYSDSRIEGSFALESVLKLSSWKSFH
jgi:hypothetical protein